MATAAFPGDERRTQVLSGEQVEAEKRRAMQGLGGSSEDVQQKQ